MNENGPFDYEREEIERPRSAWIFVWLVGIVLLCSAFLPIAWYFTGHL